MKNVTRLLWIGLAIALSIPSFAAETLTADKRADTISLLLATGALEVGSTMSSAVVRQMSDAIRHTQPNAADRVFDIVADEVNKAISEEMHSNGGLVDLTAQLYHKYFTHDEIKELLGFYQSPVGKKAGELAPVMSREGFLIGQRWGRYLAPKLDRRVKERLQREGHTI